MTPETTTAPAVDQQRMVHQIVAALRSRRDRDIYEAARSARYDQRGSGEFFITYQGGGPFPRALIFRMIEDGILKRKYPSGECFCLVNAGAVATANGERGIQNRGE